jgi:phthiodiolone/phenolphthiodiolone dimycocerosates ketoreductase
LSTRSVPGVRALEIGALGITRPPFAAVVAQAQSLEADGFDVVWYSDHFLHWFPPGVWTPDLVPQAAQARTPHVFFDPLPLMAAAAQATERIRLGTGVTDPVRRHPAVLAQSFLTLDHATGGRAVLGIGAGEAENIVPFGLRYERTASRLIEAVEVIRLLWSTTEPVDFAGDHFTLRNAILGLEPVGDRPPPIWMATHRPRVLEATGRLADGWLPNILDPAGYGRALAALRRASVAAGRPEGAVTAGLYAWMVVQEDRDAAERLLDSLLLRLIALTAPAEEFERAGAEHPLASRWGLLDFVPTELAREEALAAAAAVPGEVLRGYYFWGTPDDVVARLAPFRAAGMEHVDLVNVTPLADPAGAAAAPSRTRDVATGLRALG